MSALYYSSVSGNSSVGVPNKATTGPSSSEVMDIVPLDSGLIRKDGSVFNGKSKSH